MSAAELVGLTCEALDRLDALDQQRRTIPRSVNIANSAGT
jgi:hypothetical protein